MNNFRGNNVGASYEYANRLGHSSISRNHGYSQRSRLCDISDQGGLNEDHNFGEIEFMLEN